MFNFFKSKNNIINEEVSLMKNIFSNLPKKQFKQITEQLNEGIIIDSKYANSPIPNYKKFLLDVELLNKYEDKKGKYFSIEGIRVFDKKLGTFVNLNINVGYGIILGYSTSNAKNFSPDISQIQLEGYKINYFSNEDYDFVAKIVDKEILQLINSNDVDKIELEGKIYYSIKELEDGDFIGIDIKANVYEITHDPFEIKLLDKNNLLEILR